MARIVIIVIAVIVVIVAAVIVFFMFGSRPDVSAYEPLVDPRIVSLPGQKVMEISLAGEPDKILPGAFSALFGMYYRINETPKGPAQSAPRLRCSFDDCGAFDPSSAVKTLDMQIGIPVPDSITSLPEQKTKPGPTIRLVTWEYGETAEILHKGPYDKEVPTIRRLLAFIEKSGYEPTGVHEEEYLIGPGMFGSSPEKYYTIIRYPVKKKQ